MLKPTFNLGEEMPHFAFRTVTRSIFTALLSLNSLKSVKIKQTHTRIFFTFLAGELISGGLDD